MSQENDKIKNDDKSITVNTISNSENDRTRNMTNIETANTVFNKTNSMVGETDGKTQNLTLGIRDNMVSKATGFLIAGPVKNMPIDRKVNFLRSKGLTDPEIQVSLQNASALCNQNQVSNVYNVGPPTPSLNYNLNNASGAVQIPYESQSWFKRLFGPIALAAAVVYIGIKIYKKYIEPWLFGVHKSPVEKRLEMVELSMQRCVTLLEEKNSNSQFSTNAQTEQKRELDQIRAELKSIKSLLLNRFQFPPAPSYSSIPQWQLTKNVKSPMEQQKVNGTDTSSTSQQILSNGTNNVSSVGSHIPNVVDSDVKDKNSSLNNSVPNETLTPISSDQIATANDVADQINGDKQNLNNE